MKAAGLCPGKVLVLGGGGFVLLNKQTLLFLDHPPYGQRSTVTAHSLHDVVDVLAQNVKRLRVDVGVGDERSEVDCCERNGRLP